MNQSANDPRENESHSPASWLAAIGLFVVLIGVVVVSSQRNTAQSSKQQSQSNDPQLKVAEDPINIEPPFGIDARAKWTTSRITGSPDPPPPYRSQRVFPKLKFNLPTVVTNAPGTDRLFVAEQQCKVFSFPNEPKVETADLLIDLVAEFDNLTKNERAKSVGAIYGLTFHPQFETNRYCYICYTLNSKTPSEQLPDGTRVSRFVVSESDPPRCDPKSEQVVITWLGGGHNGGCLKFGPDGYLYISTGDGGFAFPPDGLSSGQDTSNLLSAILRIDVDQSDGGLAYAIPPDNPLVEFEGSRGEIWAYGLRNPWKMSFDRQTGDLWTGDVGWELWELVYRVVPGGNYGWSIMEGRQPVHLDRKRGPTPILPPTVEIPHTDGASITGGFVYRGKRLKDLVGTYVFGDWETRRIWGVRYDGETVSEKKDLVEPTIRLVGLSEDNDGELYLMDYDDGTLHQFVPNEATNEKHQDFPRRLSETGLFASTPDQDPADGVIEFSINVEQWADNTTAKRWIALPDDSSITVHDKPTKIAGSMFNRTLDFPADAVVAKTISIETEAGNPYTRRHLETQILHFDGTVWRGYSYQWNDEQTDATLVDAAGMQQSLTIVDADAPGGRRQQTWHFAPRAQCTRCHNPWAEHTLAFNIRQLEKAHSYDHIVDNQIRTLRHIGILESANKEEKPKSDDDKPKLRLVNPYDTTADLNERARSYLHVNCAHCHRFNGGGVAYISLELEKQLKDTSALDARPTQGTFGIHNARILSPGDPFRSVLFYRMSTVGRGRMPHIGSQIADGPGLRLIDQWIRQLPIRSEELALIEKLQSLDEPKVLAREAEKYDETVDGIARQLAKEDEREEVSEEDLKHAKKRVGEQAAARAATRAKQRTEVIDQLLLRTSSALVLARSLEDGELTTSVRDEVAEIARKHEQPVVQELFEQFLPEDKRIKKLGSVVRPEEILKLTGDAGRGKELFLNTAGVQCKNCHRIENMGTQLGPDLDQIGKKYRRAELLENILEPSKKIDPKFVTYFLETTDGRVLNGLLIERTGERIVLRDAKNKEIIVPADQVEELLAQQRSIMPELLVRDLTAEQVADLLAYLESLK